MTDRKRPNVADALLDSTNQLLHQHRARVIKILDAVVTIAAIATIPVTVVELQGDRSPWILAADWAIWLVFVVEYLVMLRLPPQEGGFIGSRSLDRRNLRDWRNWVSIAIIVLSFPLLDPLFQVIRLVRVVRLARLGRIVAVLMRAVGHTFGRRGVLYVAGIVIGLILLGGIMMSILEPETVGGDDSWSGIWWATVTAVGTGISGKGPTTGAGKGIALILLLCGVAFVTTLAGSIAAYFLGEDAPLDSAEIRTRLDEIHATVSRGGHR